MTRCLAETDTPEWMNKEKTTLIWKDLKKELSLTTTDP